MGTSLAALALYRRFADSGELTLRVSAYADGDGDALAALCAMGPYSHASGRLRMSGVKLYADGALGSRGAALLADYDDEPGTRGLLVTEPAALEAAIVKARDCVVQVATHAIGDRANRMVLDAYARVIDGAAAPSRRWRIEHAQIVSVDDIPRFAQQHVIASMQPIHATSDGPWVESRIGKARLDGAYAWRRFIASGAMLAFGSDFPVESDDPRLGLYAAITREDLTGKPPGGWLPSQKLSAAEALRGFTSDAAFAGFAETEVGRLAPGLRADFVVLDGEPLTVTPRRIPELRVRSTWVDGRAVYRAD
jgi:predicted amidohydrolase YtcJ